MNAILEQINSAGLKFVEFALPMFVQSVVLIVILLLIDFVLRKKVRAVFRYWIWLLVLVKLVLPTSLSSPMSLGYFFGDSLTYVDTNEVPAEPQANLVEPEPVNVPPVIDITDIQADRFTQAAPPPLMSVPEQAKEPVMPVQTIPPAVPATPLSWQGAVFLVWLTVVIVMTLLLLQRAIFVKGLVAQAKEANGSMADMLESCRSSMSIKRKLGLKISPNAASPAVCGLFRPVILIPQNITSSLTSNQLRAVLLHELAHIRRGDLFVNLAQTVLQIIYFYNPLLWLANCIIRRIREQAVDEMVLVAMGERAQQYPQTLVSVAKLAFKRPVLSLRLIGVVESKNALSVRIKHILNRPMPKKAKLGIIGLVVVIVIGAVLLPMAKGNWGRKDQIDKLVKKLSSEDDAVWKPAAEQLKKIGPKVARQVAELFRTASGDIHAIRVLESMATDEHVQDVMVQGLSADPHLIPNVRHCSLIILSKSGNRSHVKRIIPLLHKDVENGEDYSMAANALAELGGDDAYNALVETVTKDIPDQLRWMIADHLAAMGRPEAAPHLKDALKLVNPSHPSAGARIVEAIHRLEDKNGIEKPYHNHMSTFTLPEFDSKYSRGGYLYARDLQRANDASMYVDKPPAGANAEETMLGSLRALAAGSKGDLIFERVGEKTRLQAYHGTLLAPLEGKFEPPHYFWTDTIVKMKQSELKQLVLDYNNRHAKEIAGSIPGFRLYPFDEGDMFTAVLPSGQIAILATKKIVSYTSGVRLTVLYLDPLLALIGTERKEAGQDSTTNTDKSQFIATLPNRVTVELIGICEHPSEGKQWWRPDGSRLNQRPFEKLYSRLYPERDDVYELAIKVNNPLKRKLNIIRKGGGIFHLYSDKIWGGLVFSEEKKMLNQTIGIAHGPWKTIVEAYPKLPQIVDDFAFGKAFESEVEGIGAAVGVTVTRTIGKEKVDYRVIAVDTKGNIHTSSGHSGLGGGSWMQTTVHFKDLRIDDIKEFQFQTRPYDWVTFKNISLKPNFKTDVQIDAEKLKSQIPKPERNSANTNRKYFWRVNIKQSRDTELLKTLDEDIEPFEERVGFYIRDYDDGAIHCIDFDNDKIIRVPDELYIDDRNAILKWAKQNNVDAMFRKASSLVSLDMASVMVEDSEWKKLSDDTLKKLLNKDDSSTDILYSAVDEGQYYAFKTSQDRVGILKLTSIENKGLDHRLLLISYKLLKTNVQREVSEDTVFVQVEPISDNKQANEGIYRWRIKLPLSLGLDHGWFSLVNGQMVEHVGGSGRYGYADTKLEEVKLVTEIDNNFLTLNMIRTYKDNQGNTKTASVKSKTTIPRGAILQTERLSRYRRISNREYRPLWVGRFVHDDEVLKTVVYCVRVAVPGDNIHSFTPRPVGTNPDAARGVPDMRIVVGESERNSVKTDVQAEVEPVLKESDTQNRELSFGPVMGLELPLLVQDNDIFQKAGLIDFETGRLFKLPQKFMQLKKELEQDECERQTKRWFRENGIDAASMGVWFVELNTGGVGLISEGLSGEIFLEVSEESWDSMGSEELLSRLQTEQLKGDIGFNNTSDTFAFRTIEGNVGLLKALSVTDDGIKIRYKLLNKQAASITTARVKAVHQERTVPQEMVGTWYFNNPGGDNEQMAVFPDGRVVVLYSNGNKDESRYTDGFIELAEYDNARYKMTVETNDTLVLSFDSGGSLLVGKRWKRIDSQPSTNLLRALTGPNSGKSVALVKPEIDWVVEDSGRTRLLSDKEKPDIDNWVLIWGSAVKNTGRYLVPDEGLTLKDLIKAAGYNKDKLAESYIELIRRTREGNITARSNYSRNLKTLLSGEESDVLLKPHDTVSVSYVESSANGVEFWSGYHFGDVVRMTVNDDGAKVNMFADLDTGKLITPPDTLDNNDENAVLRWIKENGIDVMGETAPAVHGLIGFNMYAARVDNYFWDAPPREVTDRLMVRIDDPVLLSVENRLPVTYLIKTSKYKLGILQILEFTENPRGIKIRYKLLDKEAASESDVRGGPELSSGDWRYIGRSIPPDFNDTMILAEHINLGSIGHDAEGKTFITFIRDGQQAQDRQYRFVLFTKDGSILEPDGHVVLDEDKRLEEKFTFDEPFITRYLKGFRFQARPSPPSGIDDISSQLQKDASEVVKSGRLLPSNLAPPGRYAVELDGVDDYLLVPDSPSLRLEPPFTIEMWIKTKLPPDSAEYRGGWALISKGFTVGTPRAYLTGFGINLYPFPNQPSDLAIDFCKSNNSGTYASTYGGYPLKNGVSDWIHIHHVFDGQYYKSTPGHPLVMGKFLIPTSDPFKGLLGEVRLWNGARTRRELRQYENVALTGNEPGLAACWTFEQTEGRYAYDISGNNNHARLGKFTGPDDADPRWIDLQAPSPEPDLNTDQKAEDKKPEREISGVVVDENGSPIAGATVTLLNKDLALLPKPERIGQTMRMVIFDHFYDITDTNGRFEFLDFNPGKTDIIVESRGYRTEILREITTGTKNLKVTLGQPSAYWLAGEVVDGDGNPINGVEITLAEESYKTVRTDEKGEFRFAKKLEPTAVHLARMLFAHKEGFGIWGKTLDTTGGETYVKITLLPEEKISGRVVDQAGKPIADATVLFWSCHGRDTYFSFTGKWRVVAPQTETDTNGRFTLTGIPIESDVFLRASAPGYASSELYGIKTGEFGSYAVRNKDQETIMVYGSNREPSETIEFKLKKAVTLLGTLTYEDSGRPAPGVRIATQSHKKSHWAETRTDQEGRFKLEGVSPNPCNLLVVQDHLVKDSLPQWTASAVQFHNLHEGETRRGIRLVLTKGGIICGRAVDAQGNPLHGIDIAFYSAARPRPGAACQGILTAKDGTWAFRFPPGDVYVYIRTTIPEGKWSKKIYNLHIDDGQVIDNIDFELSNVVPENSPYRRETAGKADVQVRD